jgi:type VI secretion system protein ImpC
MAAEQAAQAGAAATTDATSLIDQVVAATKARTSDQQTQAKSYLKEFLDQAVKPGQVVSKDVEQNIKYWIKEIDKKLSSQLDEILHHPDYQRLEGTWRGLHYLVHQSETGETMQIRVFNASKREIFKDLDKAVEFDQSALFKKIYEEEYGTLGGHPYGMLVGDYTFDNSAEDVSMLTKLSNVAAMAHAPLIASPAPNMFNMDSYSELSGPRDLAKIFQSVDYAAWKSFRESEDSRYVALAMPRVLARLPYGAKFKRVDEFDYEENVDGTNHDKYQWMSAAWAYATRITDAMAKYGWMARTRGVEGGGKVEGLPVHTFPTDEGGVAMKCPTEIAITDRREFELSNLGFLPLVHCKNRDYAAFMGAQSCQKPKQYMKPEATANAELSAKINYIMCVSRFAHYLKVMARDKIGSFMEVQDCARWLNDWILNYVLTDPANAGDDMKARRPLAEARVDVQAVPGKPGYYEAVAYLRPHFQLEAVSTSMRLVAEIPKKGG